VVNARSGVSNPALSSSSSTLLTSMLSVDFSSLGWLFVGLIAFLGPAIFVVAKRPFPFYGPNGIGSYVLAGAPGYRTWFM